MLSTGRVLESWYLSAYFGVNRELDVILMPNLRVLTYLEAQYFISPGLAKIAFDLAPSFKALNLTYLEVTIWKIVILLNPGENIGLILKNIIIRWHC